VTATFLPRDGHDGEKAETLDALDFVARLLAHVPDPRRHLVHSYGACSNVVRGKLKAQGQAQRGESPTLGPGALSPDLRDASPWGDGAAAAPPPQGVLARLSPSRPSAALPSKIESPVPSGRVSAAAELLELPRSTMRSKIEKFGLDSTDD
jgi:hypothetical protein